MMQIFERNMPFYNITIEEFNKIVTELQPQNPEDDKKKLMHIPFEDFK